MAPITKGGLSWVQYDETRQVGTEEAVADSYEKQAAREAKIAEGKCPPEKFEKEFEETPKAFYAELEQTADQSLESLTLLSTICDEKFGEMSPTFGTLRKTLEEVRQTIHILLVRKREKDPDAVPEGGAAPVAQDASSAAAAAPVRKSASLAAMPENWEDAVARVVTAAKFMRQQSPSNPAPYLMLRGLRWGELRASGTNIDPGRLAAPPPNCARLSSAQRSIPTGPKSWRRSKPAWGWSAAAAGWICNVIWPAPAKSWAAIMSRCAAP